MIVDEKREKARIPAVFDRGVAKCPQALKSPNSDFASMSAMGDASLGQYFSSVHLDRVWVNLGPSGLTA